MGNESIASTQRCSVPEHNSIIRKLVITEHQRESKLCPDCGTLNKANFPEHITQLTQYGPRVKATVTYFNQVHFIPFGRLHEVLEDCYNLAASQGSFANFNYKCASQIESSMIAIKNNITNTKVAGFDESEMRVNGKLHWLHVARDDKNTFYEIHQKRGLEAMDAIDILPNFKVTATHDHWKPYYSYEQCEHGLCNEYHLRGLEFVHTRYTQLWVKKMVNCLNEINNDVIARKKAGFKKSSLNLTAKYDRKYSRIFRGGLDEVLKLPVSISGKRGKTKQHKAKNLRDRLREFKQDTLLFMNDFDVPFTNNGNERDIRMCKVKSKISSGFRSYKGSDAFCKIRSYISAAKKDSKNIMEALSDAFKGNPFMLQKISGS